MLEMHAVQDVMRHTEAELNAFSKLYSSENTIPAEAVERLQLLVTTLKVVHQALYGRFNPGVDSWGSLYKTAFNSAIAQDDLLQVQFFIDAGCVTPYCIVQGLLLAETLKNKRLSSFFKEKITAGNYDLTYTEFFYAAIRGGLKALTLFFVGRGCLTPKTMESGIIIATEHNQAEILSALIADNKLPPTRLWQVLSTAYRLALQQKFISPALMEIFRTQEQQKIAALEAFALEHKPSTLLTFSLGSSDALFNTGQEKVHAVPGRTPPLGRSASMPEGQIKRQPVVLKK